MAPISPVVVTLETIQRAAAAIDACPSPMPYTMAIHKSVARWFACEMCGRKTRAWPKPKAARRRKRMLAGLGYESRLPAAIGGINTRIVE